MNFEKFLDFYDKHPEYVNHNFFKLSRESVLKLLKNNSQVIVSLVNPAIFTIS